MAGIPASKSYALPIALLVLAAGLIVATVTFGAWLDEDAGWTQTTAAASLAATVVSAAVLLGTGKGWVNGTRPDGRPSDRMSLAALATGIVGLGALALVVVTYVGGASDAGLSGSTTVADAPNDKGAALSQQVSNNELQPPGYSHDVGSHPTYNEFKTMDDVAVLRNIPGGTLLPTEVPLLKEQLAEVRAFAEAHHTIEQAEAAGYYIATNDVPFMGAHLLNGQYLSDGMFDPSRPEGLLFSKLGGGDAAPWQLVGVWFLITPSVNPGVTDAIPPEGFAGNLDLWHAHHGLCVRAGIISEDNTAAGCAADSGRWIGDLRWMMHVWAWPETADNPEGVFSYLNQNLWRLQQRVQAAP